MSKLEFWVSLASPYCYLSALRIESLASSLGVEVQWIPIAMGPIYKRLGWRANPFADYPYKFDYSIRDVKRTAARRQLTFHRPVPFPQDSMAITRAAHVCATQGLAADFCKAALLANYRDKKDISSDETVFDILAQLTDQQQARDLLALSHETAAHRQLKVSNDLAFVKGVFGAPFFFAGAEPFWGDDRLEQALRCAADQDLCARRRNHEPG